MLKRYNNNPIITVNNLPYEAANVFNPGAIFFNNKYILLLRVMLKTGISILGLAESKDGYNFSIHPEPVMIPERKGPFAKYETKGIEDPRITKIGKEYYVFYSAYSEFGTRIGLAKTEDFKSFIRLGFTTTSDYRNCVLFPEKINNYFIRLERPNIHPWGIWISYSPDLLHWGRQELIMTPSKINVWEDFKIGPGVPPIKTEAGWLSIYHATTQTMDGQTYRLGVALHDLKNPAKIIGKAETYILGPKENYELVGYVHNVVFTCGAIVQKDNIKIYYGGADSCVNLAEGSIEKLVNLCLKG